MDGDVLVCVTVLGRGLISCALAHIRKCTLLVAHFAATVFADFCGMRELRELVAERWCSFLHFFPIPDLGSSVITR